MDTIYLLLATNFVIDFSGSYFIIIQIYRIEYNIWMKQFLYWLFNKVIKIH